MAAALDMTGVRVVRDGRAIVDGVDWRVDAGDRWVVLGPNGCGKTTLLRIASLWLHPTSGEVRVLGELLGRTDVRTLRPRVGVASHAFADLLRPELAVRDAVMTAKYGALEPWWHRYEPADAERAAQLLDRLGVGALAERRFATLSSGERQRVQLARTLMAEPELLLLDEPTAGLDLAAREDLVDRLADLAADPTTPPTVLVTHHVEEIPPGFTHVLLLRAGRAVAGGPLAPTLTEAALGRALGVPVHLEAEGGRYRAWRAPR
ncbi:MAG: ABC transporter ATP-binding protein [Actinobacteria bacterium]|nr:ABC transporter ATP-binding protein [Actinomycetota bacterium]